MGNHKTYDNPVNTDRDEELRELIEEYDHIFNNTYPLPDVMGAWTLDKPAGLVEILPGGVKEIGEFLEQFEDWFHYTYDGYFLYFSRFKELPEALMGSNDGALKGVLFGYDIEDVAGYTIEYDTDWGQSEFKER